MQNIKEAVQELVSGIINDNENTGDIFSDILQIKVSERLDTLKKEVAENMLSSCDDCEAEVLTQEEFDALTEEQQAEYEPVEIDDEDFEFEDDEELEEGEIKDMNKAKKNAYVTKVGSQVKKFREPTDKTTGRAVMRPQANNSKIDSRDYQKSGKDAFWKKKGIGTGVHKEEVEQIDEISQFKKDEIAHELRHEEPSKSYRPRRGRMHPAAQKHYNDMLKRQSQEREKKAAEQKSSNS
jgi:hypothetical protein